MPSITERELLWKTLIHLTFVVSALALALIDRIMAGARRYQETNGGGARRPHLQQKRVAA